MMVAQRCICYWNLKKVWCKNLYLKFVYCWYFSPLTVNHIRNGIDILVGTPGRIKDHLQSGRLDLSKLRHVVLDEVDQMLDLGFAEQVEDILHESYKTGIY